LQFSARFCAAREQGASKERQIVRRLISSGRPEAISMTLVAKKFAEEVRNLMKAFAEELAPALLARVEKPAFAKDLKSE
jgi:hypothetical protein